MGSEVILDKNNNYEDEPRRSRTEVLHDYKFHQVLDDDLSNISIEQALSENSLEENLRDDRIYLINKDYYHTKANVDPEIAFKVDAGPNGEGRAGDFDVGYIEIPSGKVVKHELKQPSKIPPQEQRESAERSHDLIRHAEEQNQYLGRLLTNIEVNEDVQFPYSSSEEAWRDVVREGIEDIIALPEYSSLGNYVCTDEAKRKASESEKLQILDDKLFKGVMLGGGENILENMSEE